MVHEKQRDPTNYLGVLGLFIYYVLIQIAPFSSHNVLVGSSQDW